MSRPALLVSSIGFGGAGQVGRRSRTPTTCPRRLPRNRRRPRPEPGTRSNRPCGEPWATLGATLTPAMTDVVEAPERVDERGLKRISHWIGGRSVAGESGRSGPVYNPALGVQTGEVDFASVEEVGRAVAAAKAGVRELARGLAVEAHGHHVPGSRARAFAARGDREDPHRRARQGLVGRGRRGAARPRGDRARVRDPDLAARALLRAGLDRDRRVLDPAAAWRRGRASRRSTFRRWCPCGCGRPRSRAATRSS